MITFNPTKTQIKESKKKVEENLASVKLNDHDLFVKNAIRAIQAQLRLSSLYKNRVELKEGEKSILIILNVLTKVNKLEFLCEKSFKLPIGKDTGLNYIHEYLDKRQAKDIRRLNNHE